MKILKHQLWHFLLLLILLASIYFYVDKNPTLLQGEFLNIKTSTWFLLAIISPVIHQIYVLICWRLELFYKSISNLFGENGFKIFKIGFAILIFSRLLTITFLAISSSDTLTINNILAYMHLALIIFIQINSKMYPWSKKVFSNILPTACTYLDYLSFGFQVFYYFQRQHCPLHFSIIPIFGCIIILLNYLT